MVDRNPLNRLESSGYDRDAAEKELKATAVESSQLSSGNVLDMADKKSAYAHGNEHMLNKVDANTTMPSTDTTVDGAYSIGHTSTADVHNNYATEFPERDSHTVGSGSRTIQSLPEHVQDLGTTVQTNRTTHIVETERDPVTYIPPQSGATTYTSGTQSSSTIGGGGGGVAHAGSAGTYTSGVTGGTSSEYTTTGNTTQSSGVHGTSGTTAHTTGLPAGQTSVVQHHGVVGENKTIDPANAQYNVNANSGVAVGTSTLGIPHGTTTTSSAAHGTHTTTGTPEKKQKESLMSKIKHAISK